MKYLFSLLLSCSLFANETPLLKNLFLTGKQTASSEKISEGITFENLDLPASQTLLVETLSPYMNTPLTEEKIEAIKLSVLTFYQENSRPFTFVKAEKKDNTLKLMVTESKLGLISVIGNDWSSEEKILYHIRSEPGSFIDQESVKEDLAWLKNSYRKVEASYTPRGESNVVDMQLKVEERLPVRVYSGFDDTGNDALGNNRMFFGLELANAFSWDHNVTYQYTASPNVDRFQSHTLSWKVPLPWRNTLELSGSYSKTLEGNKQGEKIGSSFRYFIPVGSNQFTWGADFKRTNNTALYSNDPITGKQANLTQLALGFSRKLLQTPQLSLTFDLNSFWSPGKWLPDQRKRDFRSLRAFSNNAYAYSKGSMNMNWKLGKGFSLKNIVKGQIATTNLLSSEQFKIGGSKTIRGYKEGTFSGDYGASWNTELYSPSFQPFTAFFPKLNDSLQLLAFFDLGWAQKRQAKVDETKDQILYSVGPGVRYEISRFLTAKADWGFQLKRPSIEAPKQRVHFSLIAGY